MPTRRQFIKKILFAMSIFPFINKAWANAMPTKKTDSNTTGTIYRSVNGSPEENMSRVIELIGGIERFVGPDDVVVIKPNVQWWNHGVPNLAAFGQFVEIIMNRPGGFNGEVVLGENVHRGAQPWKHAGWTQQFVRNSGLSQINNYNDLTNHLKKKFGDRFTTSHWVNAGDGGKRVYSPGDGPGYVFCDGTGGLPKIEIDNGVAGAGFRKTIMTYPIFQTDRGTMVDLKNGIWGKGRYTDQSLRFINFAAINHHSTWCGMSSAVKNYLGVSDLSGGPDPHNDGKLTDDYYNFHSFPFDEWAPGPRTGMIGAEIGVYLNTIRKADLNIVTADWVGLVSRTEEPVARTRTVMACIDPVALDYHSSKYVLYANSRVMHHNPDDKNSPTHQYLKACADHGGGEFDERKVAVKSYDFKTGRMQNDDELVVIGEKEWGRNPKAILKYLVLRYGGAFL
jgi:hypothetical protein